jgi:UDP-N-acetylmuramyl pentapeptide phosphotransferase/UDP-N-acetylglucosamine-1-phosphate transferase
MHALAIPLVMSFAVCFLLVITARWHGHLTLDHPVGVQKAHVVPVPRVGGLGIYMGLLATELLAPFGNQNTMQFILLAGVPALAVGLVEDVTKQVGVSARLIATMVSGLMICISTRISLTSVGLPFVDSLLAVPGFSILFTLFALAGLANAVNIIDGLNGLASGSIAIASTTLGAVAWGVGDQNLAYAAAALTMATLGFWLVNFPWGKIFMGDGGAYFAGFALGWLAVLLPERNPGISPWVSLLACAYPVIETLYSMARRIKSRRSMGQPDAMHLHSLVKTQLVLRHFDHWPRWARHALASPVIWLFAALPTALAWALSNKSTSTLVVAFVGCMVIYHLFYQRLAGLAKVSPVQDTSPAPLDSWTAADASRERPQSTPTLAAKRTLMGRE